MSGTAPWRTMRSGFAGIAWPALAAGASAALAALVRTLDETQWLPPEEIAAQQRRQLSLLAAHAARHSPQFRARLEAAKLAPDDLAAPDGLRRLPPLRRRDIQAAGEALFCTEAPKRHLPFTERRTSGSTGEPVAVRRTAVNGLVWAAHTIREHFWHGRDLAGRVSAIRAGRREYRVVQNWGRPMSLLFETGPAQIIPIETGLEQQMARLAEFRPTNLILYPSNLEALAEAALSDGFALPGLEHLRTVGEMVPQHLRDLAREAFGFTIEDMYSSEECGVIAVQCPVSGLYHTMAESLIVEVLDEDCRPCGEGETGALVVTDLHNFATPLIRYAIGDWAEPTGPCACGRGLPTLRRIVGRERNLAVTPDGRRFWPRFGRKRFREIAPILQFQMVQETPARIEVRLLSEAPLSPAQEAALGAVINENLGYPFELRFTAFADRLPTGPNGKFEEFISKVQR